jgi:cysteinyl-tRNA synthetase
MVRLDGTKMSKSLGNLVFVSGLLADGVEPMAVRLAILAHHYRPDWDWTDAGLAAAQDRLSRWRDALGRALAADGAAGRADPRAAAASVAGGDTGAARGSVAGREAASGGEAAGGSVAGADAAAERGSVAGRDAVAGADVPPVADVPPAEAVLAEVRDRIAADLDAPGALAAIDRWAAAVLGAPSLPPGSAASAALVRDTVDALLGIAL